MLYILSPNTCSISTSIAHLCCENLIVSALWGAVVGKRLALLSHAKLQKLPTSSPTQSLEFAFADSVPSHSMTELGKRPQSYVFQRWYSDVFSENFTWLPDMGSSWLLSGGYLGCSGHVRSHLGSKEQNW